MSYKMRSLLAVTVLFLSVQAFAQDDSPAPPPQPPKPDAQQAVSSCPQMQIQSQARTVREGQPVTFTARITGGDKAVTPSILWNLSSGLIQDGQGTPRITVDSTGAGMYREIVAELWLGGYSSECPLQSSPYRVIVVPPAVKVLEFGEVSVEDENEKIAAAVNAALQSNDRLQIIGYAGRKSERTYISTTLRRMREQIVKGGMQPARFGVADGGFREEPFFEIWIIPDGAEPPRPTPTIDRKEIVYPTTPRTTRTPVRKP